ncbi:thioesterase [Kribbella sandramycini]|uniref:Pyochelin biosynthetic protein PchC n=1 Tax=Kribbella sandramycini TaxID=60450 RepID=A0A7Y4NZ57_9ACTN|nr:alpha/beta fold hydrolase [Kribbella sandramycini]MBB6569665.1 pyochelin biosynthetic protein PchC [Kribbella sandramycini]NOL40503.1 thioesterase [Kribbella sandramycini]
MPAAWFRCRTPRPQSLVRLVCLPHAGGTASFFTEWDLGPEVEVLAAQYPGRSDRIVEPCLDSMTELAPRLAEALDPLLDRPLALFGHSMGAALAYEVARLLDRPPIHLFVSGRHAPAELVPGSLHTATDDELVADLMRLGGTEAELFATPELRNFFLPTVRADYRLAETYRWQPGPEPSCPITVLFGDSDPEVTAAQAERWRQHAVQEFAVAEFPGDHFYLAGARAAVQARIGQALRGAIVAAGR